MTKDDKAPTGESKKKAEALAAALRANLIRRKAARNQAERPAPQEKDSRPERAR